MKHAASEIKSLRPIQEAIVCFFKAETWEEVEEKFGVEVVPEKLLRFAVSTGTGFIRAKKNLEFQLVLEQVQ